MPALSPTMTAGNIAEWKVSPGSKVNAGDVIADIETDKATMALESMEEGYIAKILVPTGAQDVQVGEVVAIMVEEEGDCGKFDDYVPSASAPAAAAAPAGRSRGGSSRGGSFRGSSSCGGSSRGSHGSPRVRREGLCEP